MQTQKSPANTLAAAGNDSAPTLEALHYHDEFVDRHIGPSDEQIRTMLTALDLESLDALVEKTVPESISLKQPLALPRPQSESDALARLKELAGRNQTNRSYIGLGYYDTFTPNVIARNVLENPGWYTSYTPYQPEIAQGRLECLLNFQQMVLDLTAMDLSNASLLDDATSAAEAISLATRVSKNRKASKFCVDEPSFQQPIDVLKSRAERFGVALVIALRTSITYYEVFRAYVP